MNMLVFFVSTAKLAINFKIKDDNSLKNHLTLYFSPYSIVSDIIVEFIKME